MQKLITYFGLIIIISLLPPILNNATAYDCPWGVYVFDLDGEPVNWFIVSQELGGGHSAQIKFGPDGNIWLGLGDGTYGGPPNPNEKIVVFTPEGSKVREIKGNGLWEAPRSYAWDQNEDIYISALGNYYDIYKYDISGNYIKKFNIPDYFGLPIDRISDILITSNDRIYVSSWFGYQSTHNMMELSTDGEVVNTFSPRYNNSHDDIALSDSNMLWVRRSANGPFDELICGFDLEGNKITQFSPAAIPNTDFLMGLEIHPNGNLLLLGGVSATLYELDYEGNVLAQTALKGLTSTCHQGRIIEDFTVGPNNRIFVSAPLVNTIWYVDSHKGVSGNGTSWDEAFKTIQEAVSNCCSGLCHEIWVKQGIYYLDFTIQVDKRFAIYGGFAGTETEMDQRDWANNTTIINGQNTVRCFLVTADAIIDGFTITNGYTPDDGGGMRIERHSPTIENCTFSGNRSISMGGAILNDSSSPIITSCTFSANDADGGGAIRNRLSSPTITNCTFSGNSGGWDGGAIYNYLPSSPIITNCIFSGNDAYEGGAIRNNSSSPTITNCTFLGNRAEYGGAIYNSASSPTITNCILWADSPDEIFNSDDSDPTVTFSDIEGGYPGEGNIDTDPLFHVNYVVGDTVVAVPTYSLQPDSPCIDAGTSQNAPDDDIDGGERPWGAGFDMGADEYIPPEEYWTPERMRNAIPPDMGAMPEPEAEHNMPDESEWPEDANPGFKTESLLQN